MTQTPKQWATTGFIIGVASGIAAAAMIFFLMRNEASAATTPPAPAPAAQSAVMISGTIDIDPAVAGEVPSPAVVFVIARDETKKGHPLLAKRLDVRRFPVAFSLGPEDVMMGQAPPPRVFLEARIDRDGDAATREPGSPSASIDAVAMGSTDVRLRLH